MKAKLQRWLDKKVVTPLVKWNNKRIDRQADDRRFLEGLCIDNRTLDLDKYLRLMKMIKRKYKK